MKRIIGVILILVMLTSAAGCNRAVVEKEGEQASNVKVSMFVEVECMGSWRVVYHRETKVMYAVSSGYYNGGTFTVLVDENGWPLIWEGEK